MRPITFAAFALSTSALFATAFLAAPIANAFGVGIQPSTVEMTIKPGERQRQVVTIGNVHTERTISLTLGLADWSLDEDGRLILDAPGDTERSAAEWIRFSPASVTLKPETRQDVVVEITTPFDVETTGDHRFALLATTLLPELDERGEVSGVWNRYQLTSLFYLTLGQSESLPVVKQVALDDQDPTMITMKIKNEGDAHARLQGEAQVVSASGDVVAETPLNAVVLDNATRTYDIAVPELAELEPGEYTIDFRMNNSFVPQNKFKSTAVDVESLSYVAE
jgi:hypothetical protein